MLDPFTAKKAGIKMGAFDTFSNPKTESYREYEAYSKEVMIPVKKMYQEQIKKN